MFHEHIVYVHHYIYCEILFYFTPWPAINIRAWIKFSSIVSCSALKTETNFAAAAGLLFLPSLPCPKYRVGVQRPLEVWTRWLSCWNNIQYFLGNPLYTEFSMMDSIVAMYCLTHRNLSMSPALPGHNRTSTPTSDTHLTTSLSHETYLLLHWLPRGQ